LVGVKSRVIDTKLCVIYKSKIQFMTYNCIMKKKIEPSFEVAEALRIIGKNLRVARLRRSETASMLAQRIGVGRETVERLERGDGGVSSALLLEMLNHYGFGNQLFSLGDPDQDTVGKRLDALRRPLRGRGTRSSKGNDLSSTRSQSRIDPSIL